MPDEPPAHVRIGGRWPQLDKALALPAQARREELFGRVDLSDRARTGRRRVDRACGTGACERLQSGPGPWRAGLGGIVSTQMSIVAIAYRLHVSRQPRLTGSLTRRPLPR